MSLSRPATECISGWELRSLRGVYEQFALFALDPFRIMLPGQSRPVSFRMYGLGIRQEAGVDRTPHGVAPQRVQNGVARLL